MIDIALIQPGKDQRYATQEPLNLGFLASYLMSKGLKVKIFDELAGQDIEEEIERNQPRYIGITAVTPLALDAYRIADWSKKKGITTIMGGVHATVLPQEVLEHVDIVVKGEGEYVLYDIISQNLKSGVIQGRYVKNLDEIPIIDRGLFEMDFYLRVRDRVEKIYLADFVSPGMKVASMLTSRGCPWNCTFCHNTWRGLPFRYNSAQRVVTEVKSLIDKYKIGALFFLEDNFFCLRKRAMEICQLFIKEKLDIIWGANARVDNITPELLQLAKEAGCRQITFGFESGSQKMLDIWNKKITPEQIKRAIYMCQEAGIIPNGTFIIGGPTETLEDIKKSRDLIKETGLKSCGVCIATPFPGTELWRWCEKHGRIPKNFSWSDFNYAEVPIPVSDFSTEELKMLRLYVKKPKSLKYLIFRVVKSPWRTIKGIIKNPKKLWRVFRLSV